MSHNDQRFTKSPQLAMTWRTGTSVRSRQKSDEDAVVGRFRETASYAPSRRVAWREADCWLA
jgi:hypothetical protein